MDLISTQTRLYTFMFILSFFFSFAVIEANNARTSGGSSTYSWTANPADATLTDPTVQNPTVSPTQTTTYTVTADFGGCTTTNEVTVTIQAPPVSCSQNLVPNPSFENINGNLNDTGFTPGQAIENGHLQDWLKPNGSTDFYYTGGMFMTDGNGGQIPRTGNGKIGFFAENPVDAVISDLWNYKEYIQVELTQPLVAGETYDISFYVSLAERSVGSTDRIGAYLSPTRPMNNPYTVSNPNNTIEVTPQIESPINVFLEDYTGWIEISGSFVAIGGEQWITIGNFRHKNDVNFQTFTPPPPLTPNFENKIYYYLDDVSVLAQSGSVGVSAGSDQTINSGESSILAATPSGGTPTYNWAAIPPDPTLTDPTAQSPTVSPTQTTTYTVTADFGAGCTATDEVIITVVPPTCPVIIISENVTAKQPVSCAGQDGVASVTVSGVTDYTITWTDSSGQVISVNDDLNPSNLVPGIYDVTVVDNSDPTCTETIFVTVVEDCPQCSLSIDDIMPEDVSCFGASDGRAQAMVTGPADITYSWQNASGTEVGNQAILVGQVAGPYSLTIASVIENCSTTINFVINEPGLLVINTSSMDADCGMANGSALVMVSGGTPPYSYTWEKDGDEIGTGTSIQSINGGRYTVTGTDANNCEITEHVEVVPLGGDVPEIDLGEDFTLCLGDTYTLDASYPEATYLWQDGSSVSEFLVTEEGFYRVQVENDCGVFTDDIFISVVRCTDPPSFTIKIANTLTPNGDGDNDTFFIENIWEYRDNYLQIFNRWGTRLYEQNGYSNEWDGTYQGKDVPMGTYYYVLELNDNDRQVFKGSISVIR